MKLKRKSFNLFKIWVIRISVLVIFFGGYYLYAKSSFFTITRYEIEGVDTDAAATMQTRLGQLANGYHLVIFPNNKIFTYNTSGVISAVRDVVSDLGTIDIRPIGLHTVHIKVSLLTPLVKTEDGKAITADGIIFLTNKDLSSYPFFTIASSSKEIVKVNGLPFLQLTRNGEKVDGVFLNTILSMSTKVSSIIFPVASILVESTGDVLLSNASGTSKVMFMEDADQKKLWSTLVSSIDTEPLKSKIENNRHNLMYLDARYGNKVFYRFSNTVFQNNNSTDILEPHASSSSSTLQTQQ